MERIAPVAVGAGGAAAAAWLAPESADETFFSVAAQVVPVILLALAIEVRAVGTRVMRAPPGMAVPRMLEFARRLLELMLVLALLAAEWHALRVVSEGSDGSATPALVWPGIVWGFMTVAVLAVFGTKRARPHLEIDSEQKADSVVVKILVGNDYGDKDLNALFNLFIPPGHGEIRKCRGDGTRQEEVDTSPSREPGLEGWTFVDKRLDVPAGDCGYLYYLVDPGNHRRQQGFEVVVHLDHQELRGGRRKESAQVAC